MCCSAAVLAIYWSLQSQGPARPLVLTPRAAEKSTSSSPDLAPVLAPQQTSAAEPNSSREEAQPLATQLVPARLIEGRLLWPSETPSDERAFLRIDGRLQSEKSEQRIAVQPDGNFHFTIARSLTSIRFKLDARYLYLDSKFRSMRPVDQPVALKPKLGMYIRGLVLLPNGSPAKKLAGSRVTLDSHRLPNPLIHHRGATAELDQDAHFEFRAVSATNHQQIKIEAEGYPDATINLGSCKAGEFREVTLQLENGILVRGSVTTKTGSSIAGAELKFTSSRANAGFAKSWVTDSTVIKTDDQGKFEQMLSAGSHELEISRFGFLKHKQSLGELTASSTPVDISIVLQEWLGLTGFVFGVDGSTPVEANVTVTDDNDPRFRISDYSNPDGSFRFTGLQRSTFTVIAEKAPSESGPRFWAWARNVEPGQPLSLTSTPGHNLLVQVTDDIGEPLSNCSIFIRPIDAPGFKNLLNQDCTIKYVDGPSWADISAGIPPGTYGIFALSGPLNQSAIELIDLRSADAQVTLAIPRGVSIRGHVMSPAGDPISGAYLHATFGSQPDHAPTISSITGWVGVPLARTSRDGAFALINVQAGRVTLIAKADSWKASAKYVCNLSPGESVEDVRLQLRDAGRMHGLIFPEAMATAPHLANPTVSIRHQPSGSFFRLPVNSNGEFIAEDLEPGNWTIYAFFLPQLPEQEFEVLEGQTTEVVLGQPKATTIEVAGRLSRSDVPLSNTLILFREGLDGFETTARSNAQGEYCLGLPQAGKYFIQIGRSRSGATLFERQLPNQPSVTLDFELPIASLSGSLVPDVGTNLDDLTVYLSCLDANVDGFETRRSFKVSMQPKPFLTQLNPDIAAQVEEELGRFRFEYLPPGHYRIRVAHASNDLVAFVPSIHIGANSTDEQLDIAIAEPARARCRAFGPNHTPLQGARIRLRNADGLSVLPWYERSAMNGEFEISAPPGEYTLHAEHGELAGTASLLLSTGVTTQAEVVLNN